MPLKEIINDRKNKFEKYLFDIIKCSSHFEMEILDAMMYSIKAGGKRLRGLLLLEACQICGGNESHAKAYAAAVEMIHTYSLIHDDLPAMDNDDYRRGKLTNHKVYGEAIAILAGDSLLNYAFELMLKTAVNSENIKDMTEAMLTIATASGYKGMIGGQVVDLKSEGKNVNADTLDYIHAHKTAALIEAPLVAGAQIAGASPMRVRAFRNFGYHLGMAFQIIDDILDIEGDSEKLGKPIGSDYKSEKMTYPRLYGIDKSREMAKSHSTEALLSLTVIDAKGQFLNDITNALLNREY